MNESLKRSIQVNEKTRPIKIAYIVPSEDGIEAHYILDAVFFESYTRWCGALTLIVPTLGDNLLNVSYLDWLAHYDPDIICSYSELAEETIKQISHACNPIVFFKYQKKDKVEGYKNYIVDWYHEFSLQPLCSISTIIQLSAQIAHDKKIVLATQMQVYEDKRFFSDNFGIRHKIDGYTRPIGGLYDTLLFDPENNVTLDATFKTNSQIELLDKIGDNHITTMYELSVACTENHPRGYWSDYSDKFKLFIGNTCLDRINFWNSRLLTSTGYGAIIVSPDLLNDIDFKKALGSFLNKNNFLGSGGGAYIAEIRSFTLKESDLLEIQKSIQEVTHNHVSLPEVLKALMLPKPISTLLKTTSRSHYTASYDTLIHSFKINETLNKNIEANRPNHLLNVPSRYEFLSDGQWVVDLEVERANNLSMVINAPDVWRLPIRPAVTRVFTERLSRVTQSNLISLIPIKKDASRFNSGVEMHYDLCIPTDEIFFSSIIQGNWQSLMQEDLRLVFRPNPYQKWKISDKGQYLRGVISMLGHLDIAYKCLTEKFWRDVLRRNQLNNIESHVISEEIPKNIFTQQDLYTVLERNRDIKERLLSEYNFKNERQAKNYLRANFDDSLEFLVHQNVFSRIYQWRCVFCGHSNVFLVDELKNINHCQICMEQHNLPISFEWKYKLNEFVWNALCKSNNGLSVLWTIGFLHENLGNNFFYLPEVQLFNEARAKAPTMEIDVLCVIDGKLYVGEVKKTVSQYLDKQEDINKFIEVIERIKPDVALLAFEAWGENEQDIQAAKQFISGVKKTIEHLNPYIQVQILIAADDHPSFNMYQPLYPLVGKNSREYWNT